MPRKEKVNLVSGLLGLDLSPAATEIDARRWRRLQNYYPPRDALRILAKRLGSAKYNATAIAAATRIDNLVRAWKADGTKALIAAVNRAGTDQYHVGNDAAGTLANMAGGTDPAAGSKHFFVNFPLLGRVYMLNGGASPMQKSADLATKADVPAPAGIADARFGQFGTLHYLRLVTAATPTNPNYVYGWDVAAEAVTGAGQFVRIHEPVTALGHHVWATQNILPAETLLVFGAHSMWGSTGDPFAATPAALLQYSGVIGTKSPKTVVDTPLGVVFLGSDRYVYLAGATPGKPERVGARILPALQNIPEAQLIDACACYHNGFYKLYVADAGGTTNTLGYWADLLPATFGESGVEGIEWYGPMVNLALLSVVSQDGPGDALEMRGGDDTTGTVWKLDQASVYTDGATPVQGQLFSKEFNEDDPLRQKIWNGFTFGYLKQATGSLSVNAVTDAGATTYQQTFSWSVSGALWDVGQWDVALWGGDSFQEDVLNWPGSTTGERIVGRTVQLQMTHALATDFKLRDYGRKAKMIQRML